MKNRDIETILKEYYKTEEKSFSIPAESGIAAFHRDYPKTKRLFGIKVAAMTAACMALVISAVFIAGSFLDSNFSDIESTYPADISEMTEPAPNSAVPDWYEPKEFSVEYIPITQNTSYKLSYGGASASTTEKASIDPMSVTVNNEGTLPFWVSGTEILNERYVAIYYDAHYDIPFEDAGMLVYDINEGRIRSIVADVYESNKAFFDSRNTEERHTEDMISCYEFGKSTEWGLFDVWNESVSPVQLDRYMINIETGEMRLLPARYDILAVSRDYKYIVWCYENENKDLTVSLLDTETMEETVTEIGKKSHTVFSDDNRYIIFYKPKNGDESDIYSIEAEWFLYDIESRKTLEGRGKIIRFSEKGDAVITRDDDGAHIYTLDGLDEVTDSYELQDYEKYELRNENGEIYRFALFKDEAPLLIAQNIVTTAKWTDYHYFYCEGADEITVYSETENKTFLYDISSAKINEREYHKASIYVTDGGKKCNVVTFFDEFKGKYEIVIGELKEFETKEIILPKDGETISYGDGFTIFETKDGYKLTAVSAFRFGDTVYFKSLEQDYIFDTLWVTFLNGEELFYGITPEDNYGTYYSMQVYNSEFPESKYACELDIRQFRLESGEDYDENKSYFRVTHYTVITEDGETVRG